MQPRALDPIELEVLSLFANGKSTEDIGAALKLDQLQAIESQRR